MSTSSGIGFENPNEFITYPMNSKLSSLGNLTSVMKMDGVGTLIEIWMVKVAIRNKSSRTVLS